MSMTEKSSPPELRPGSSMSDNGRRVYLNEFNIVLGSMTYLPLVSGLLRSFAETRETIQDNFSFQPFQFKVEPPEAILDQYDNPAIAAFSVSMWNEQLNLRIAEAVKAKWPDCLIVFGGAQVPHKPIDYFKLHPFIDVAVRGEGEESFADILERSLTGRNFDGIPGVSWRDRQNGDCVYNPEDRPFNRDLDFYPSPYLSGVFDELMASHPDMDFQSIIETNRGCPFLCTFCYWGKGGLSRKYRYHGLDRVKAELEWSARRGIKYVFNADSNFGMHKRDMEIAETIVELKKKYGFPEKFRTCYGKNTDQRIFEIGALFHQHDIEKGITLSRQSLNAMTLKNIKRDNIKLEVYTNLQKSFNDREVPVYCEMILGLPGETYDTWIDGIETLLQTGLKNQIFIYHCQVFNNTELANPEYREKFGLKTRKIALEPIHSDILGPEWVAEVEETVVETNSMSLEDWRRMSIFSWTTMLMHSMKAGFFIMNYLTDRFGVNYTDFLRYLSELHMAPEHGHILRGTVSRFDHALDNILAEKGRAAWAPEYGRMYWEQEEMRFLELSQDVDSFYAEFEDVVFDFLADRGIKHDASEVREAVLYQKMVMPTRTLPAIDEHSFEYNFPEYFEKRLGTEPVPLQIGPQTLTVRQTDFDGNSAEFARKVILWGRKSGLMLRKAEWASGEAVRYKTAKTG